MYLQHGIKEGDDPYSVSSSLAVQRKEAMSLLKLFVNSLAEMQLGGMGRENVDSDTNRGFGLSIISSWLKFLLLDDISLLWSIRARKYSFY